MKVRLQVLNGADDGRRVLELRTLPRVGELLESASYGTCEVVKVVHTPEVEEHEATIVLRKMDT